VPPASPAGTRHYTLKFAVRGSLLRPACPTGRGRRSAGV